MLVTTDSLVSGGSCIARLDGKAVFVPYTLPGETVEIEIVQNKKDYAFARLLSVVESSPHRITPRCQYFGRCGGCNLQMADPAYQKELRLGILKEAFSRAHAQTNVDFSVISQDPFEYRSRFQFHRTSNGGVGLKEGSSSLVVPVTDCPVAVPEIRAALADGTLADIARKLIAENRFHVFARAGQFSHSYSDTVLSLCILDRSISFDVRGFFQSNIGMLELLIHSLIKPEVQGVQNHAGQGDRRLLDFYAGVGTFSAFAGPYFAETVLVEHNKDALSFARGNLRHLDSPPIICALSDDRWSSHRASRLSYELAIIDPPRQGLAKAALQWFCSSNIAEIRYVSCDPVTLARDAAKLISSGYEISEMTMFDFYPQTSHLETLAVFKKK